MNRRKAFRRIFLIGSAGAASYIGFRAYMVVRTPELNELEQKHDLIAELAETIIPRTDTPGAKDAEVGVFIIKMVKECMPRKSQNNFLNGLSDLENYSLREFNRSYVSCTPEQRNLIMAHFERKGKPFGGFMGKVERKLMGDSFFTSLKKLTVLGYCTSKPGATQAFAYDYIPGKFQVTPLLPGQKAWASQ